MLYDRIASHGRAMAACSRLILALNREYELELRLWRIAVAASPVWAAQSHEDIAAAELVVVALSGCEDYGAGAPPWTTIADQCGGPAKCLLIAVIEAADERAQLAGAGKGILGGPDAPIQPDALIWTGRAASDRPLLRAEFSAAVPGPCADALLSTLSGFP